MQEILVHVHGMSCQHCVQSITKSIKKLYNEAEVIVSLENKTVLIKGNVLDKKMIKEAIEDEGFNVVDFLKK